jgi:multidrug efflux pump subunit AcrB
MFSLLVARLLTPLMAAYLLRDEPPSEHQPGALARSFASILSWTLAHRWMTVGAAAVVLIGSLALVPLLPTGFYTPVDRSQFTVQVEVPAGSTLDRAHALVEDTIATLRREPTVASIFAHIESPTSTLTVLLVPPTQRDLTSLEVANRVRPLLSALPDRRAGILSENGTRDISIQVLGDDPEARTAAAEALAAQLRNLPQFANVVIPSLQRQPQLIIKPRREVAARLGVDASRLAQTIRIATEGDDAVALTVIPLDGRMVPVRTRLDPAFRSDPTAFSTLRIPTSNGGSVPLASVAEIIEDAGPANLERADRTGRLLIEADLAGGATLGTALDEARKLPAWSGAPGGVRIAPIGDAENMEELFSGFAMALGAGILAVYLLLVLLYHDAFHPLAILCSLPFAIVGAIAGLLIAHKPLDLAGLIGILMLMGIVAKNAILVIDEALQRRHDGASMSEALHGASTTRARPIIMTTLAMIAGMIPIVIGLTPDAAFRAPMAWVVIGGLISSTALSLLVVPAMASLTDGFRTRMARHFGSLVNHPKKTAADRQPDG